MMKGRTRRCAHWDVRTFCMMLGGKATVVRISAQFSSKGIMRTR